MNLLFAYPIIMPVSNGCGNVPIEVIYASLIVVNGIGLITFLLALIINKLNHKGNEYYKEGLIDTIEDSFLIALGIGLAVFADFIAIFIALTFWIATLL